jgi:glycosyltransferase involved in cell wall biosynthesis
VALMLNNNQLRKKQSDLVEAWRLFTESLPADEAAKAVLVLHAQPVAQMGTDLPQVAACLAPKSNVIVSAAKHPEPIVNQLYNIADVAVNISNAEGFGLATNEAMLAGTPIIANVVGGLVDQIGFTKNSLPVEWTPANYSALSSMQHGNWSYPVFGQRTIIGNPATPYLYDYNASIDDIVKGLQYWYNMDKEQREAYGLQGRQYAIERSLTADSFGSAVVRDIKSTIANYKPVEQFNIYAA